MANGHHSKEGMLKKFTVGLVSILVLATALAAGLQTRHPCEGVSEITTAELKKLFDENASSSSSIRSAPGVHPDQDQGLDQPPVRPSPERFDQTAADKSEKLVFYCLGPG